MAGTRSLGSLTLDLIARVGGFTRGLSQAERESQRRVRGIQNTFRGLQRTIAGTFAALGGAALVRSIVRNTTETENALAQLNAALRSTGGAAGYSRDQLVDMAQQMSASTTHSINEITRGQTRLLSYTTLVGETYPRALQTAIDQSVRLGISIEQSAEIIGRALETPSRGVASLTRQGFQFTEAQKSTLRALEQAGRMAEAQAVVLDVLEESYGGAARAARDTFGGALTAVKNAFGDLLSGQGGLSEATSSLNEFADLLRDPATVSAANTLTSAIISGFNAAAEAITGTVNVVKFLGEELAARVSGAALDDIVRMEQELERIQEILASDPWTVSNWMGRFDLIGQQGVFSWWSDDELRSRMETLKKALADAYAAAAPRGTPTPGAPAPSGPTAPPPPSEEFLKLEERLKQQIALYGQVGEAARIAYQIQSGQLDDLSESEQQRILRLARQYDLLVENAAAEKELEAARKQLDSALKSQIANYEQQIALTGEVTELERIRYEIANGALKGIAADQAAYLESLAQQIDANKAAAEAQREWEATLERGKALTESLRTPLEVYQDTLADVNELLDQGAISYETYSRAVEKAQKDLEAATKEWNTFKEQAARNTQDIIADTLVNGFEDGAKGILKAFGNMIVQLTAQAVAADLAGKLFGSAGGGTGDGWINAALSLFGGVAGRAAGGPVSAGNMYRVNEVEGEYFIPNSSGTVVPLSKMKGGGQIVTNNFTIQAPQGTVSRQTEMQIAAAVARGIARANGRNN